MDLLHQDPLSYMTGKSNPYPELTKILGGKSAVLFPAGYWLVPGYEECKQISADQKNFSVKCRNKIVPYLLGMDPPEHIFARKKAGKLFSKININRLHELSIELSEKFSTAFVDQKIDFVERYAFSLPTQIIGFLLGVKDTEQSQFNHWVKFLMLAPSGLHKKVISFVHYDKIISEIDTFFLHKLDYHELSSTERPMIYDWYFQMNEESRITKNDFLDFVKTLMVAGIVTVTCFISNTLIAFYNHPELWKLAQNKPSILVKILEESLRFEAPIMHSNQTTLNQVQVGDAVIPSGQQVIAFFGMANRDSQIYEDPHLFNPFRKETVKHLSFGYGPHVCMGANLARLIAVSAYTALLEKYDSFKLEVEVEQIEWIASSYLRGPIKLPVRFKL